MRVLLSLTCLLWCLQITGQELSKQEADRSLRHCLASLQAFVAIPNNGLDRKSIDRNITWLTDEFVKVGFKVKILPTTGNPILFAQLQVDPQAPTLLFYMHLDGQPVDPNKWDQENPYQPVLKEKDHSGNWHPVQDTQAANTLDPDWRLFGRSAADDKAPIVAFLHAISLLKKTPSFNLKLIIDAEEEIGSKSLPAAIEENRDLLAADLLIINDGPVHISGQPTLVFGCRGMLRLDLTTYGPIVPQHSGHFGNYAPNPVFRLAHLLASMKDDAGRVLIEGYYDGIELNEETQRKLREVPDREEVILKHLQVAKPEMVGHNYQESLQYPSLNIRGIAAGWVGAQARTIVPDKASVALDIRLVPESKPDALLKKIRDHITGQGFHIVDHEPTESERRTHEKIIYLHHGQPTLPFRTDMQSAEGLWLKSLLRDAFGNDPVSIRIMGGTVPISEMINQLAIPAIILPMVNADNNQHSPNENMRIGHLANAIKTFFYLFQGVDFPTDSE